MGESEVQHVHFRVPKPVYERWIKEKEARGDHRTIQEWMRSVIDAWFVGKIGSRPNLPERIGEVDMELLNTFVKFAVEPQNDPQRTVVNMIRALAKYA